MPQLGSLSGKGFDQMRVRMAQRVDRYAGRKIEIALAVDSDQPASLATLECERRTRESGKKRRPAHPASSPAATRAKAPRQPRKIKKAAQGAAVRHFIGVFGDCVNAGASRAPGAVSERFSGGCDTSDTVPDPSWGKPRIPIRGFGRTLVTESAGTVVCT
jgi:hypothetical protein